ncbi:MAG: dTDP-4-dehydrorhamnose reductase [bacterium]|nr:dTDP-4-dehydrorhamnose reductase [bacterium]
MRALVFGGRGMLARAVVAEWRARGEEILAPPEEESDIRSREALVGWAERFRPRAVINCAAYTAVDACEENRETAMEVNGRAVANVVAAAEHVGAELIQVSTDYVFGGVPPICPPPGEPPQPFREDAPTAPQSVYGESKLLGEDEVLRYARTLAVRTSWLFGAGGPNFVATMRRLLDEGRTPLRVVDDQVGCPTYTPFLARAIRDLLACGMHGVVHYCNRDAVSWHGFACEIARAVDPTAEVVPVKTSEFPRPAPRPAYSVLDVTKFETAVDRRVEPWADGLAAYLDILGDEDP